MGHSVTVRLFCENVSPREMAKWIPYCVLSYGHPGRRIVKGAFRVRESRFNSTLTPYLGLEMLRSIINSTGRICILNVF
eukprot:1066542-Prorocentrum_minimum.AAC.5